MIELPHEIVGADLGATTPTRTLIWGHGLTTSRRIEDVAPLIDWTSVAAKMVRYDARGHGEAPSTPDVAEYGWDSLARDQLSLADSLGIEGYVAAGASMGCGTAIHAAVLAPTRVQALVLVIPPTAWETRAGQTAQWNLAADVLEAKGIEPMIANLAALPVPDPFANDPGHLARRADALRSWDTRRLAQVFRGAAVADLPPREAISLLTMPTLILAWTGDPTHPVSTARELAALLPHASLELASTSGDLERWTKLVADFVRDLS